LTHELDQPLGMDIGRNGVGGGRSPRYRRSCPGAAGIEHEENRKPLASSLAMASPCGLRCAIGRYNPLVRPWSLVAWVVALTVVTGAGPASADWTEIKTRGTLRVVFTWPEANYFARDGDPAGPGLERELLEGFARLHGLKLETLELAGYDELIPALLAGRGDVVACNITVTEARLRQIAFTTEILPTRQVVVTRRPHRVVRTLEELREERVVTIAGTSMAEAIAAAGVPAAHVHNVSGKGIKLCDFVGQAGTTAAVEEVAVAILRARERPDLQMGLFLGAPGSMAWGVRKTDTALLTQLNEYVSNTRRTPTWSRLVVHYFGEAALDILRQARGEK
jgi:membrane-bound lytic murein transglycosylase MltF